MAKSLALISGLAAFCASCAAEVPLQAPPATTIPAAVAPATGEVVDPEAVDPEAEQFLQRMVAEEHLSGVVLIRRHGVVVHKRAYGEAAPGRPNRVDGRFHIASMTKQFTAAAIMRLAEQGKLRLDETINEFLPPRYRSARWSAVTVKHLLSHSSGIPDYAETRDYYDVTDGRAFGATVDGMIREAMQAPLQFEPGSRFRYSNIGYTLLGQIIEQQSGRGYADYIETELLDPMGMRDSAVHDAEYVASPRDAEGMRWDAASGRQVHDDIVSLPVTAPDGGLITTLDDFARWIVVYRDMAHPRLSRGSIVQMSRQSAPNEHYHWPQQGFRGEAYYGLGLMRSGDLVMHEGYVVGFRSYFIYSRRDDLLIVLFTNTTSNDVFRIASGLFELQTR
ncbi:serine hydrolase domain-containing protein [Stakelama tenebrarum]|uniref:Beta-lactamase family protein n=1 Tax=Stakelama tenebrarum TaxID=2711215 RepID=A0A6G6Y3F7_9SPHN|nr:serine hydrolase domain-containing protein [Sphingosinithalassobacter tenebrarum]QIG79381.1 beta-lactamase family protein [Sphingosinithalassobacter tenebrarum]